MSVSVSLTLAPTAPNHGDTVTATYVVTGNNGSGSTVAVNGDVTVGVTVYAVNATITLPGTPAQETFTAPICPGLTFKATSVPNVFTAAVP